MELKQNMIEEGRMEIAAARARILAAREEGEPALGRKAGVWRLL